MDYLVYAQLTCLAGMLAGPWSPATAAAPATATGSPAPALPTRRPNIILILADDLGYGDLGCYGQQRVQTPRLDRLAAEGMRFTQCYAGSTVCAPSRAVLMTGYHSGHARIRGNAKLPLESEDITVAEVLKQAGYGTGAVGKWGLGLENSTGHPNRQGFNEWFGYLDQTHAHNYYPDHLWRNEKPFPLLKNANGAKGEYSHDFFTRAALNFVRLNQRQPFFLYLAYTIPHANNELGRETGNGMEVPSDQPYSAQPWPAPERNKAAMITRLDTDVGRLVDLLRELRLDRDTVVFFTSDNGPHREGGVDPAFFSSSGPLRGIKRDLYEGGIRVPMIAWWPGAIKAGSVSDQVWAFWDFLPTTADLARTAPPTGIDGISMLPTLLSQPQTNQHSFFYWEFHERGFHQAIRRGDWKGVRHGTNQPLEVYNLGSDLAEKTNVAALNPAVVKELEACLATARTPSPHWPGTNAPRARP